MLARKRHASKDVIFPHIGVLTLKRPIMEGLDFLIEFGAKPRYFALADPTHAQGSHQLVHFTGAGAGDVCLLLARVG